MKIRHKGFTLIELLIVVALVALLASLAVPSFRTFFVKRSVDAAVDAMVTDLRFARSEAIKRSTRATLCRSTNGTSCGGAWIDGWIVFIDQNGDGVVDAGDEILRVQQRLSSMGSIASTAPGTDRNRFTYQPTGRSQSASQTFIFAPSGSNPANTTRLLCISNQGRPGLKAVGATSCAA